MVSLNQDFLSKYLLTLVIEKQASKYCTKTETKVSYFKWCGDWYDSKWIATLKLLIFYNSKCMCLFSFTIFIAGKHINNMLLIMIRQQCVPLDSYYIIWTRIFCSSRWYLNYFNDTLLDNVLIFKSPQIIILLYLLNKILKVQFYLFDNG